MMFGRPKLATGKGDRSRDAASDQENKVNSSAKVVAPTTIKLLH